MRGFTVFHLFKKCSEILFGHISCILALLVMRHGFILDRLGISHLMLAGLLKMNHQKLSKTMVHKDKF